MKKGTRDKTSPASLRDPWVDVAAMVNRLQQQLATVEMKVDVLVNRSSERPLEERRFSLPFPRFEQSNRQPEVKQPENFRQREMHKAVCADCKKACEVPFKPSGDRPVYCKDCFSKRKNGASHGHRIDNRPRETGAMPVRRIEKPHVVTHHKGADKKKASPRRKASSKR